MKRKSTGVLFVLLIFHTALQAQNDKFNWGFGYMGSAYSYSAVLENKATSPYKYNVGQQLTLTRYLSHNFDIELSAGESEVGYYSGVENGEYSYTPTQLYDGAIHLKYKFDNGYIIKEENYRVSPYVVAGAGASYVELTDALDLMIPVGFGLSTQLGKRLSFTYQSSFRYNVQAANAYWAHGIGLKFNFGKIGIKRITATRERERERKLERIAKRDEEREKRRLALEAKRQEREALNNPTRDAFGTLADDTPPALAVVEPKPVGGLPSQEVVGQRKVDMQMPIAPVTLNPKNEVAPTQQDTVALQAPASQPILAQPPIAVSEKPVIEEEAPTAPAKAADDECASLGELSGLGRKIVFKYGSSYVNSDMIPALKKVIGLMDRCPSTSYAIMAHTDASGDARSNLRLSEKRGIAIRNYLIQNGIAADRLVILPCGEYAASGDKNAADRCITFKINHRTNR